MFHVNEACDGKGTLTVKDGEMQTQIDDLEYKQCIYRNAEEGEPEETACRMLLLIWLRLDYTKVIIKSIDGYLLVICANNDMAGEDEDSWLNQLRASEEV